MSQGAGAASEMVTDPDAPPAPPPAPSPKARRRHWLALGLAGLILLALAFWLDLGELARLLGRLHPAALLGIVLLLALDRVLMAWKWLLLLRAGNVHLPLAQAIRFYFQGTLAGLFMPSMVAGDVLRGYWAARLSGATSLVFASLIMEKMLGVLSALLWGLLGFVVFASWRFPDAAWLWPWLGLLAAAGLIAVFVLSLHERVHERVLGTLGRLRGPEGKTGLGVRLLALAHKLYTAYSQFAAAKRALGVNFALTLGEHLLQMLIQLALALALGLVPPVLLFLAVSAAHTLILRLPVSPEGWGVGELSAVAMYGLIGIDAEAAVAIMLVYHALVLVTCLPALFFLLQAEHPARAPG